LQKCQSNWIKVQKNYVESEILNRADSDKLVKSKSMTLWCNDYILERKSSEFWFGAKNAEKIKFVKLINQWKIKFVMSHSSMSARRKTRQVKNNFNFSPGCGGQVV
jgi:hypothetical protein